MAKRDTAKPSNFSVWFTLCSLLFFGCDQRIAGGSVDGALLFAETCARCHGPVGQPPQDMVTGLGVKPLRSEHVQAEMSEAQIREQILNGSKNKLMPAFAGALTEPQIEALVKHVKSLTRAQPSSPAR